MTSDTIAVQFHGASVLELRELIDGVGAICPEGRERASTLYRDLAPELKKNRGALEGIVRALAGSCEKCRGVIAMWKAGDDTWKTAIDVVNVVGFRSIFTGRKPPGYLGMVGVGVGTPKGEREKEVFISSKERSVYDPDKAWDWSEPRNGVTNGKGKSWHQNQNHSPAPPPLFPNLLPQYSQSPKVLTSNSPKLGEASVVPRERRPYDDPRGSPFPGSRRESRQKDGTGRVISTVPPSIGERVRCHLCSDVCIVDSDTFTFEVQGDTPAFSACSRCLDKHRLRCEACCKTFFGAREPGAAVKCQGCLRFEAHHTICEVCFEWTPPEKVRLGAGLEGHLEDPVCEDCVAKDEAAREQRKDVKKKRRLLKEEGNSAEEGETPSLMDFESNNGLV